MREYQSLVELHPKDILPHGPTKLLVDEYLWHNPEIGCIASYKVKEADVKDHFGLFRGVDQLEFFAQSSIVSLGVFHVANNSNLSCQQVLAKYNWLFLGVDRIRFHCFVQCGEKIISIGVIKKYLFKQMTCSGKIYKVPDNFDMKEYCAVLCDEDMNDFKMPKELTMIAEFENVVGWCVKKERLNDKRNCPTL